MNEFQEQQLHEQKQECFFAKILRECSMEKDYSDFGDLQNQVPDLNDKNSKQDKLAIDQFSRWKGIDDSDNEDTFEPEPKLVRAQSLRMEQQRKVNSFMTIFGKNGIDPLTGKLKTFSPNKHKRIGKGKK